MSYTCKCKCGAREMTFASLTAKDLPGGWECEECPKASPEASPQDSEEKEETPASLARDGSEQPPAQTIQAQEPPVTTVPAQKEAQPAEENKSRRNRNRNKNQPQ